MNQDMVDSARNQSVPGIFIPTSVGTDIRHTRNGVHEIPDKTLKNKEIIFKKGKNRAAESGKKRKTGKIETHPATCILTWDEKQGKWTFSAREKT